MKSLQILSIIAASLTMMSAANPDASLELLAQETNARCPAEVAAVGTLDSVSYQDKCYSMYLTINDEAINIDAMKQNRELVQSNAINLFGGNFANKATASMIHRIADANASLSLYYRGEHSGDTMNVVLSAETIKAAVDKKTDVNEDPRAVLEQFVATSRMHLPMPVDEATVVKSIALEKKKLIYTYEFDESFVSFKELSDYKDYLRADLKSSLRINSMYNLCKKLKIDIVFKYVGDRTGKSFNITIPYSKIP